MRILFQDDYFISVFKPAGMLVHQTRVDKYENRNLVAEIKRELGFDVKVIHRLDKSVAGVILFALSGEAATCGAKLFRERLIKKKYLTLVRGYTKNNGEIRHALEKTSFDRQAERGNSNRDFQRSLTRYNRLATAEIPVSISRYPQSRYSLLEAIPETGRTHQIRRHFKQIRNPIIGDTTYGDHLHNRYFREKWGVDFILLHAFELAFAHPITNKPCKIQAPVGEVFNTVLNDLDMARFLPEQ